MIYNINTDNHIDDHPAAGNINDEVHMVMVIVMVIY